MNTLYNTAAPYPQQQAVDKSYSGYVDNKRGMSLQPESLFSMAMYDFESMGQQQPQQQIEPLPTQQPAPAFHPVDEYKDMSLKQLLDLSDDYLFGEDDEANMSSSSILNPLPLNVPSGQNVAQAAARGTVQTAYEPMPMDKGIGMDSMTPLDIDCGMPSFDSNIIPMVSPSSSSTKKRRREVSDDEDSEDLNNEGRFRPYQAGQWAERFNDLKDYREKNGNCLVPHTYKENLPLARWVKRQRYQYKLMVEGKSSTMTEERVTALEEIGFIWDSQGAAWGERLEELKEFRSIYMHCNVPSNYSENPQLATWVKCQRRQYKLHMEGKPSNMTAQRIRDLETIGFEWLLRSYKKARTN